MKSILIAVVVFLDPSMLLLDDLFQHIAMRGYKYERINLSILVDASSIMVEESLHVFNLD